MGGRGGSSGLSNEKPVSKLIAKVYFNSSKKSDALRGNGTVKKDSKLEKVINSENTSYFKSIKTKSEAVKTMNYINDRLSESKRKIAKLGSAEALFKNQRLAIEHRKLVNASVAMRDEMHKFSKTSEKGDVSAFHDTGRTTTTYDKARKRRMKNFDSWFFGSGKK